MKVPFLDLKAQYHSIKPEIDAAISGILESSQFVLGEEVAAFEREFAAYCGAAHGIAVNSGTSALHLAFLAAGIGPGDEVITIPHTFVATVAAIGYTGARAVYVDIDPVTFTMDPAQVEAAITPRTKAIAPVHLYGQAADMDPILEVARRHGLVGDRGRGPGPRGEVQGAARSAASAEMACFSFYPGKNLGAYGEGGIVVTSNEEYAHKIRMLRDWGQDRKYHHILAGYNYRMEGMQGADPAGEAAAPREVDRGPARARRSVTTRRWPDTDLVLPVEAPATRHVYHVYAVRTRERQALMKTLDGQGIQTGIHYPVPVHLQPAYRGRRVAAGLVPAQREGGRRGPLAADVPGDDQRAHRGREPGHSWPVGPASSRPSWGCARSRPIPPFEAGMAVILTAEFSREYLLELYQRHIVGEDEYAQMMRRVIVKAVARKRCGDGLIVGSQVGFKHLETFQIGSACFIGAGAYIQGRFDGRCVIGNNVWIGPGSYFDARDMVIEDYVGWGPGPRCSARRTPAGPPMSPSSRPISRSGPCGCGPGPTSAPTRSCCRASPSARARSSGPGPW